MKKLTHLQQQLVNLILYKPQDLRKVLAQVANPTYALRFLDYLLPYRVGVEIDIAGLPMEFQNLLESKFTCALRLKKGDRTYKYPLTALDVDGGDTRDMSSTSEIKISFSRVTQLKYFQEILSNLESHTLKTNPDVGLAKDGGLHIHIDAGKPINKAIRKERLTVCSEKLVPYFRTKVFGLPAKSLSLAYLVGDIVAYRHHHTLEYRLGTPTFDYTKIMRWVLCCQVLNRSIRMGVPFNKELTDAILAN